jgi:exopolyphosphatase / guanosine-5'-triphosphate,3'-diphosphate pyrophosphatase
VSVNRNILVALIFIWSVLAAAAGAENCNRTRAAFDVGSGATKMVVAKIDICQQLIVSVLLRQARKVAYNDALASNQQGQLPQSIVDRGINALLELKVLAVDVGATEFVGVATSAFRRATNGSLVVKQILKRSGILVKIISQRQEAILGYLAVESRFELPGPFSGRKLVVWDIGGGSMQITARDTNNFLVYQGKLASVSFKRQVIRDILGMDLMRVKSPNPIGARGEQGITLAQKSAKQSVPKELKQILTSGAQVVGIGGVHYYSVRNRVAPQQSYYRRKQLYLAAMAGMKLSDQQLDSAYAATEVTNLMLVVGYMLGLNIDRVDVMKVNMADGVLLRRD